MISIKKSVFIFAVVFTLLLYGCTGIQDKDEQKKIIPEKTTQTLTPQPDTLGENDQKVSQEDISYAAPEIDNDEADLIGLLDQLQ